MIDEITIQPGKVHKYLSRNDGGLQHKKSWSAIECVCDTIIQKLINLLPKGMVREKNKTATPSTSINLFAASNNDTVKLLKDKVKDLFHTITTATASFISRI